jgi:hypothetical protein
MMHQTNAKRICIWCSAQPSEHELSYEQTVDQVVPLLRQAHPAAVIEVGVLSAPNTYTPSLEQLDYSLTFMAPLALPVWQQCQAVAALRAQVAQWGIRVAEGGTYQLPLAQTAKGTLFGEVFGLVAGQWQLPIHTADRDRQQLYGLGRRLLSALNAPVGCYFLQFSWQQGVIFDRLWPFPTVAALASVGVQTPDWFTAYYCCLAGQPLRDLRLPDLPAVPCLE